MRPITDRLPKPLIPINGRSMLDRALDELDASGIEEVVVNTHHLAPLVEDHLKNRKQPVIHVSFEQNLLETGGGIARALHYFSSSPFLAVNGDILWSNGSRVAPLALAEQWDDDAMDALLLLQPVATAVGYRGVGDFVLLSDGRIERRGERASAPVLFAGLQVLHPRLFTAAPTGSFSLNVLYDQASKAKRLFGVVHDGGWCHVGTPSDISLAEAFLSAASRLP